jgi:hypothetical protein
MKLRVILALALFLGAWGRPVTAQLQSPFSNSVWPAQVFTATGQTGNTIPLNNLMVSSTVGSSFASGTITVTGSSLTTVTFSVMGSSDNGVTFYPLPIYTAATPTTTPSTTITVTANGLYQVSLAGITHVKFVTSGTFTATNVSLVLTASPNVSIARGNSGGGGGGSNVCLGVDAWSALTSYVASQFACFQNVLYTATGSSTNQQPSPGSNFWILTFSNGGAAGGGVILGGQFFGGGATGVGGNPVSSFVSGSGNPLDFEQQINNDIFSWGAENDGSTQNFWSIALSNTAGSTTNPHNFTVNWASGGIGKDEWHQAVDNFMCWATNDSATACKVGLSLDNDGATIDIGTSQGDHSRNLHVNNLSVDGTCSGCGGSTGTGFPITIGGTSIGAESTNSTITNLTLLTSSINGITPLTSGSATQYLDATGHYSTPPSSTGTVTSFAAPAGGWPNWCVPTVTNSTTTPSLSVACANIPNAALANSTFTIGSTTIALGATVSAVTGLVVNGVTLNGSGSSSLFLNQAGGYSTPAGSGLPSAGAAGEMPYSTGAGTTYTVDGNLTRTPAGILRQSISGSTLTSATTIAPTSPVTYVSGSATISVMTPPSGCTSTGTDCTLKLIASAGSTWSMATGGGTGGGFAAPSVSSPGAAMFFIYDPAVGLWYPASSSGSNLVGPVTISGSGPGAFSLPCGSGALSYTLPAGPAGWHAPPCGGTPYVFTPSATWTQGLMLASTPVAGTGADTSNQSFITSYHPEFQISSGAGTFGANSLNSVINSSVAFNNLHAISIAATNITPGSGCTTPPQFEVFSGNSNSPAITPHTTVDTQNDGSSAVFFAAPGFAIVPGNYGVIVSSIGSGCSTAQFVVTVEIQG